MSPSSGPSAPRKLMDLTKERRVFDGHLHIIDPRFPLIQSQGYLPEPFTVRDYVERTSALDLAETAVELALG